MYMFRIAITSCSNGSIASHRGGPGSNPSHSWDLYFRMRMTLAKSLQYVRIVSSKKQAETICVKIQGYRYDNVFTRVRKQIFPCHNEQNKDKKLPVLLKRLCF
jgi:hypothetical protein